MSEPSVDELKSRIMERFTLSPQMRERIAATSTVGLKDLWEASDLASSEFAQEVADHWEIPLLTLPQLLASQAALERFSPRFLRESKIFPFQQSDGQFVVALADPSDRASVRAAEIVFGCRVPVVTASFDDISTVLEERLAEPAGDQVKAGVQHSEDDVESLRDLASGAPVVRGLNDLLERAVELRASDIHIEPVRNGLVVRFRVDGVLRNAGQFNIPPQALISRIKILASLNIAERRLPQDGAARIQVGRTELDIRVATMPTQHGESSVIRLLPRDRGLLEMSKLGLNPRDEKILSRLLGLPNGMVIITGPTGSGKTTTLATMLSMLNDNSRKILTIEDPVEYEISGINQSQVKPSIGLTFATALRSFLRQDPDVIMVGEIRDAETARIAIHAALTGHLVLTTLHTETAAAAVPRLLDLGIEAFLLNSTLRAVVAQRLVRVLCDRCKRAHKLSEQDIVQDANIEMLGFRCDESVYEAVGCERCSGSGYRGRYGAFEVLEMTPAVRKLVRPQVDSNTLDEAAISQGMTTMLEDAAMKCRAGLTTVREVLRVATVR